MGELSDPGILKAVEAAIRKNRSVKKMSITGVRLVCAKPSKHGQMNLHTSEID